MRRPKNSEVIWDYFYHSSTPDLSYRVEMSREHMTDYFRLRHIKNGKDNIKYFYGETAWMDITRFIHDLGDWTFNIDDIINDMVSYAAGSLKGTC